MAVGDILNVIVTILIFFGAPFIFSMLLVRFLLWKDYSSSYKKINPILKRIYYGKRWQQWP